MNVYHFDKDTGDYTGTTEARVDPLEYKLLVGTELANRLNAKKALAGPDLRKRAAVVLTEAETTANLPPPVKYLLPANATFDAPPSPIPDGSIARMTRGLWTIVEKPVEPVKGE